MFQKILARSYSIDKIYHVLYLVFFLVHKHQTLLIADRVCCVNVEQYVDDRLYIAPFHDQLICIIFLYLYYKLYQSHLYLGSYH